MTHPVFDKELFIETAFERRFQGMPRSAWQKRAQAGSLSLIRGAGRRWESET